MMPIGASNPVEITAAETYALRQRVLRNNQAAAHLQWDGDNDPGTFHLGIRDGSGSIVAVSTWLSGPSATQIRGMATDPALIGGGLGSRLLTAGIERCRSSGSTVVWANARVDGPSASTNAPVSPLSAPSSRPPTPGFRTRWCV